MLSHTVRRTWPAAAQRCRLRFIAAGPRLGTQPAMTR
jgi:hypothetical protein